MDYRFSPQGLTFSFPNPYRVENQFLLARGGVLLLAAFVLAVWVLSRGGESSNTVLILRVDPTQGSTTLAMAAAGCMALFGVFELVRAVRQWSVQFGPGQPASLAAEIHREATGVASGAQELMDDIRRGVVRRPQPQGPYLGLLSGLASPVAHAPRVLAAYLQARLGNLLGAGALLLVLGPVWWLASTPMARGLVGAVVLLFAGVLVARSYRRADTPLAALGPVGLAVLASVALVSSLLVWALAPRLPLPNWVEGLALPAAAAALLLVVAAIEALGLYACRAQLRAPGRASSASEEAAVGFSGEPALLFQEIDREFHRHWAEGIPNRRYAWQPLKVDAGSDAGTLTGVLFEESQPMPPAGAKDTSWGDCRKLPRLRWLVAMDALGVLLTLGGCVAWVRVGYALSQDVHAPKAAVALGLVLTLAGGYAMRAAHRLWGRLDFESTLTCLDFKGSYTRMPGTVAESTGERSVVDIPRLAVRAWVVRARSVIHGALDNTIGSRTLLAIAGDAAAARGWVQHVRAFAQGQGVATSPGALVLAPAADEPRRAQVPQSAGRAATATAADAAALIRARSLRAAEATAAAAAPPARAAPRFCSACGTPVLAGARFCQQCGTPLLPA